WNFICWSGIYL
ncbi:hypothetical protein CP02DC22_0939B, partial [Chlamydia psittaci 02DC22]